MPARYRQIFRLEFVEQLRGLVLSRAPRGVGIKDLRPLTRSAHRAASGMMR